MIVLQDVGGLGTYFERIDGNPVVDSLDGERRAPLQVVLHPTWTEKERAEFGIHVIEPFVPPEGKMIVGSPEYVMVDGKLTEVYGTIDIPEPKPYVTVEMLEARVIALEARIAALEGKQ